MNQGLFEGYKKKTFHLGSLESIMEAPSMKKSKRGWILSVNCLKVLSSLTSPYIIGVLRGRMRLGYTGHEEGVVLIDDLLFVEQCLSLRACSFKLVNIKKYSVFNRKASTLTKPHDDDDKEYWRGTCRLWEGRGSLTLRYQTLSPLVLYWLWNCLCRV